MFDVFRHLDWDTISRRLLVLPTQTVPVVSVRRERDGVRAVNSVRLQFESGPTHHHPAVATRYTTLDKFPVSAMSRLGY